MNHLTLINISSSSEEITMSSREIAELTGKEHKHVMRDIRNLQDQLGAMFGGSVQDWAHPQNGQIYEEFVLGKDTCLTLLLGYDAVARMKVVKRWQELEAQTSKPKLPENYLDALKALVVSEEQKQLAIEQRDEAIRTKSEIGSRREATAMATASVQTRKVISLEAQLDKSKQYSTIKRMEKACHGQKFNWRLLKSACQDLGIQPVDVYDQNYGTVRSYPAEAWMEAYALDINNPNEI